MSEKRKVFKERGVESDMGGGSKYHEPPFAAKKGTT